MKRRFRPEQGKTVEQRFWEKVDIRGPDECWPWIGGRDKRGYGRFRADDGVIWAHIYALRLKLGRPLKVGMETLHSCDNNPCCNPGHLEEGPRLKNMRDMFIRGRARPGGRAVAGLNGTHNHGRGRHGLLCR